MSAEDAPAAPIARIGVTSAQIAAARLQITLDRKFGRETKDIIKKIAAAGDHRFR